MGVGTPRLCFCGTVARGVCTTCGEWFCGAHSELTFDETGQQRRYCGEHTGAAFERRAAVERFEKEQRGGELLEALDRFRRLMADAGNPGFGHWSEQLEPRFGAKHRWRAHKVAGWGFVGPEYMYSQHPNWFLLTDGSLFHAPTGGAYETTMPREETPSVLEGIGQKRLMEWIEETLAAQGLSWS